MVKKRRTLRAGSLPVLQAVVLAAEQPRRAGGRSVPGASGNRCGAEAQLAVDDLDRADDVVERLAEHRQDHLAAAGLPVDVEPAGRRAVRTVAQHRPPRRG